MAASVDIINVLSCHQGVEIKANMLLSGAWCREQILNIERDRVGIANLCCKHATVEASRIREQ